MGKVTLEGLLSGTLALSNKEQNQHLPPSVFTEHAIYATNFMVDFVGSKYPADERYISLLRPFMKRKVVTIKDGKAKLPKEYRHFQGAGAFLVGEGDNELFSDKDGECTFPGDPQIAMMASASKKDALRATCRTRTVGYLSVGEYNKEVNRPYEKPSITNPICCVFEEGFIQVCPFDVKQIELRYVCHPKDLKFGYIMLPDGTYQYDPNTSEEIEWDMNAYTPLINALTTLMGTHTRDTGLLQSMDIVKRILI